MTTWSLLFPSVPSTLDEVSPFARRVAQQAVLTRLWQGQAYRLEPSATFAALASVEGPVPVGTCVAVMPMRHPRQAALEARTLAHLSGCSPIYGIGPGSTGVQRSLLGQPYPNPVQATREYIRTMRRALDQHDGVPGDHEVDHYFPRGDELPPLMAADVAIGVGVLRPAMARLAGQTADAAITWLALPEYLATVVVPEVERAARQAGRRRPRVVAMVPVALDRPGRSPAQLVDDVAGGHFALPHYRDTLSRAGLDVTEQDPLKLAADFVAAGGLAYGTPGDVAGQLRRYEDAGVDEVVLTFNGVSLRHGLRAVEDDLDELLPALV